MGRPASKAISGSSGVYPYAKPAGSLANRPLASWSMPSPACSMDANPTSPGSTNIPSLSRPCERIPLGQMPESDQGTLTAQLTALLQDVLSQVDSQVLRLVYVSDDEYHPSDYYHAVLRQMHDPHRPWRQLEWIRIIDYYHACLYIQR